ncbi:hypothetical protein FNV43_RR02415 [Rhamnella rubrinervis]|uniref:Uncharacterized protein n=1 Tax=Rhamnella rubrinervis TaxID=2594499 RepID=A0A8K0HRF7_9ROSA|nr:hypothetical protein FNV43_RR02415 [Rhamnella rubrinervis]
MGHSERVLGFEHVLADVSVTTYEPSRLSNWVRRRRDPLVEEPVPSTVGYQDVGLDAESSHHEQERGLHTVARYLTDAQGFGGSPDAEEDPEEVVTEDSMGTDDYVPSGYTSEPKDPEDFDP